MLSASALPAAETSTVGTVLGENTVQCGLAQHDDVAAARHDADCIHSRPCSGTTAEPQLRLHRLQLVAQPVAYREE